ncbi:hypothetical protein ACJBY8_05490, partial [Streptococcus suis]
RKSNEYAINTLYHKCTVFVSFNYKTIAATTRKIIISTHFSFLYKTAYLIDKRLKDNLKLLPAFFKIPATIGFECVLVNGR